MKNRKKLEPSQQTSFSIEQLQHFNNIELNQMVFKSVGEVHLDQCFEDSLTKSKTPYFMINITKFILNGVNFTVLKISDVTISVQFDLSQGEKRILQLINACVSHEMRNPINSIIAMNLKLKDIFERLVQSDLIEQETRDEIQKTLSCQEGSSKLLSFYVCDLLCLSQIEKGTFKKKICRFDVRNAIREVVSIQAEKAEAKRIQVTTDFIGFNDGVHEVVSDMVRFQQAVL